MAGPAILLLDAMNENLAVQTRQTVRAEFERWLGFSGYHGRRRHAQLAPRYSRVITLASGSEPKSGGGRSFTQSVYLSCRVCSRTSIP